MAKKQYDNPTNVDEQVSHLTMQLLLVNGEIAHYEAYKLDNAAIVNTLTRLRARKKVILREIAMWETLK